MRTVFFIIVSTLSLFTLPALADDMATMPNMHHQGGMGDIADMHSDGGMMTPSNTTVPSTTEEYHSQGTIKRWNAQGVAIAHHAVPSLNWPPMTMTFSLPPALAAHPLASGTEVDFSFHQDDQGYSLTAIHPIQP
ncbi:copper-binding protein [Acerihabitans sp. TG2]|uniref:copper-binding protein n=1 Tax=Acerihabitans sp. TG2 TaxID=3096008 RepID=UPI002B228F08|nr:copper-binding protein [Acerihabitans sp. TG2]MEA9392870.1 copper-binding protein [Acerihabitans sp. TG2]